MRNFKEKRRFRSILNSKIVLIFLSALVLFFAWGVIGFMVKMETVRENRKIAENKFIELQKQKEHFSREIAKLNTEEGKEDNIREKFGLAKEGEGLIVIVEDKNLKEEEKEDSGGFWGFIKNLFN